MALPTRDIVLIADDFALSEGVSAGITRLARAQRITGTSALVTLPRWKTDGAILAELRDVIAIGLHMNLTLGLPLGNMPSLAPEGRLPDVGTLVRRSVLGRLDRDEIAEEIVHVRDSFHYLLPGAIDRQQQCARTATITHNYKHDSRAPTATLRRKRTVAGMRYSPGRLLLLSTAFK